MIEAELTRAGLSITTVTTDDDGVGRRLRLEERHGTANGASRVYLRKWLEFYKIAPEMVLWLWRNITQFDAVHIHALFSFTSVAAGLVARIRGVPYVVRPLGTLSTYGVARRRPWLKRLSLALFEGDILRRAAAVHFTSRAEWDEAKSIVAPLRGVVIPLGVERSPAGDERLLTREHPEIDGRRVILFLSRIDPKKNIEGLLRAFAVLDHGVGKPILLIAGEGTRRYRATLESLVRALDIEEGVVWLGHVDGERKAAAFAAADIFVLPSFSENFGIAVVEALLAGLPCVLGQGVAIARDVQQAGAGVAVVPEPDPIAAAIGRILADDALRRDMIVRGRAFAEREYSLAAMSERLVALYGDICRSRVKEVS